MQSDIHVVCDIINLPTVTFLSSQFSARYIREDKGSNAYHEEWNWWLKEKYVVKRP